MRVKIGVFSIVVLLFAQSVFAQTTNGVMINYGAGSRDNSAILDLQSTGQGFLAPRVTLTGINDNTTITTPATSLLVYNTATATGITPGYYYNSGTSAAPVWVRLLASNATPLIGSGVATRVAFWTDTDELGSSPNLFWDNSNNELGIGVPSPSSELDVNSLSSSSQRTIAHFLRPGMTIGQSNYIKLGKESADGNSADLIFNYAGNNSANNYLAFGFYGSPIFMSMTRAGNVGIGSNHTNPQQPLDVLGTGRFSALDANADRMVYADSDGDLTISTSTINPNALVDGAGATPYLTKWSDPNSLTNSVVQEASSKIGIGMNPVTTLDVNGNFRSSDGGRSREVGIGGYWSGTSTQVETGPGNHLLFGTSTSGNPVERMRILNDGKVGIGNTNPDAPLTVGDGTTSAAYVHVKRLDNPHINLFEGTTSVARIQGDIVSGHNQFQITKADGTSPWFNVNQDDGNVGIGTTSPAMKLHVASGGALLGGQIYVSIPNNNTLNSGFADNADNSDMWLNYRGFNDGFTRTRDLRIGNGKGGVIAYYQGSTGTLTMGNSASATDPYILPASGVYLRLGSSGSALQDVYTNYLYAKTRVMIGGSGAGYSAPLYINGSSITTPNLARCYFNSGGGITCNTSTSGSIQVEAVGYYWSNGGGYISTSDKRIKDIIGVSSTSQDLATISKIEITDYQYIDKVNNGSVVQKKVIAQQLQSVFPNAISTMKGVIPSVYEVAATISVSDDVTVVSTTKEHGFTSGDNVKLILEKTGAEKFVMVDVVDNHVFRFNERVDGNIFVYGKKVDDLLTVDYDALTTLNISATQELTKRIIELEKENSALREDLKSSTNNYSSLKAEVATLKEMMVRYGQN